MKAGKAERLKTNQMQKKVFSEDNLHPIKRLEERKLMQKRRKESFLCACVCACVWERKKVWGRERKCVWKRECVRKRVSESEWEEEGGRGKSFFGGKEMKVMQQHPILHRRWNPSGNNQLQTCTLCAHVWTFCGREEREWLSRRKAETIGETKQVRFRVDLKGVCST